MNYITDKTCSTCGNIMTIDDVKFYGDACFSCCSKYHAKFELAHGGLSSNHKRIKVSDNVKEYILSRDKKCLKCGSEVNLTIDHVMPISKGGDNHHSNLQCLCRSCNSIKSNYPHDYREVIEL